MTKGHARTDGFTLIELLTVIAIIGILAALTAAVLPRAIEKAHITETENIFHQLEVILTAYTADHATYPPAYGYLAKEALGKSIKEINEKNLVVTEPYMLKLRSFREFGLYDNFSNFADANQDGEIDLLEFSPNGNRVGERDFDFPTELYNGKNLRSSPNDEVGRLLRASESRPLIYLPVNLRQVRKASEQWFKDNPEDPRPTNLAPFGQMRFPPAQYDAYVLISVGPQETLYGLLSFPANESNDDKPYNLGFRYHILGIMAYYMASRDADGNGQLDFDFRARTRGNEAKNPNNALPGEFPNAAGPLIFVKK